MQRQWWLLTLVGLLIGVGFALFIMGWVRVEVVNEVAGREVSEDKIQWTEPTIPEKRRRIILFAA